MPSAFCHACCKATSLVNLDQKVDCEMPGAVTGGSCEEWSVFGKSHSLSHQDTLPLFHLCFMGDALPLRLSDGELPAAPERRATLNSIWVHALTSPLVCLLPGWGAHFSTTIFGRNNFKNDSHYLKVSNCTIEAKSHTLRAWPCWKRVCILCPLVIGMFWMCCGQFQKAKTKHWGMFGEIIGI